MLFIICLAVETIQSGQKDLFDGDEQMILNTLQKTHSKRPFHLLWFQECWRRWVSDQVSYGLVDGIITDDNRWTLEVGTDANEICINDVIEDDQIKMRVSFQLLENGMGQEARIGSINFVVWIQLMEQWLTFSGLVLVVT